MSRLGTLIILLAGGTAASGCATLGGNVKGDFACRAPVGTCAPMTSIDAGAVAQARGGEPAEPAPVATPARALATISGAAPSRSGERAITILLPAYVDEVGILHDSATVHAVVEPAGWTMGAAGPSTSSEFSRGVPPSSLREAIAGASAPAIEGLESLPAQAPHVPSGIAASSVASAPAMPSAAAVAAARAGHRIGTMPTGAANGTPAVLPSGKVQLPQGDAATALTRARALTSPVRIVPSPAPASRAGVDGDPGDPFRTASTPEQPR